MTEMHDKLRHLMGKQQGLMTGAQWRQKRTEETAHSEAGDFEIQSIIPGEALGDGDDSFYCVRREYPLDHEHGRVVLRQVMQTASEHVALSANDEDLVDFDPRTAVYMDTETTGLSGGTGTVAFLVGAGYFTDDAFVVEQCFMRDYHEEESMLHYLDELFKRFDSVVTYNGKSFDVPLLRTRCITNRIPFRLDGRMHYDLVHAARRFFRKRLKDCSLGNIERHILNIKRTGDVPSHEIPARWFRYLQTRDARPLKPVFYHHQMDIVSLVALTARLSESLTKPDGAGFEHTQDRLSLVRVYFLQKRYAEVVTTANALLEAHETDSELDLRNCLECLAFAHKRLKNHEPMADAWRLLLNHFPRHLQAREELAKYYEHERRDYTEALRITRETVALLEQRSPLGGYDPDTSDTAPHAFQRRLHRLERKAKKRKSE